MKISLLSNKGKKWITLDKSFVKGFAFIAEELLNEEMIYNKIINAIDENSLSSLLGSLNGNFTAVVFYKEKTYLITDKFKTYPLLYTKEDTNWIVTDQAKVILSEKKNKIFDETNVAKFLAITYLDDDKTILKDVYMVSSGTYVIIDEKSKTSQSTIYHQHIYSKNELKPEEIIKQGVDVADRAFKRIFESIGDRRIVIPLSGGYDSRWIACMCKRFNITNVLCYTYGVKDSWEVAISEKVAKQLGYEWYYVEFTPQEQVDLLKSSGYEDYCLFANNLNTLPHRQDYLAIEHLVQNNIINSNDVIFPGHSGDVFNGGHTPFKLLNKNQTIAQLLFYSYGKPNLKRKYSEAVLDSYSNEFKTLKSKKDINRACDLHNNWNIQNRQSNYIINSVRIYEYFNLDWRIPLWEDELAEFWLSIQWKYKNTLDLYNDFLFVNYFKPMGVDFYKKEYGNDKSILSKIRLPFGLKDRIKNILFSMNLFKSFDPNGSNKIVSEMNNNNKFQKKYLAYRLYDPNRIGVLNLLEEIRKYDIK